MKDKFHAPITVDEFKYVLGIWANVTTGKLPVPEADKFPKDGTVSFEIPGCGEGSLFLFLNPNHIRFKPLIAIAKEFHTDVGKCSSLVLHFLLFEQILIDKRFRSYIDDKTLFEDTYLNIISDYPIRINNVFKALNLDPVLEAFGGLRG